MTSSNGNTEDNLPQLLIPTVITKKRPTTCAEALWDVSQEERLSPLVRYKKKPSLFRSPDVDYFAPIQKVLDNQKTSQLLLEDSKSKSDLNNNVTNQTSSKGRKNRKRARTSDISDIADVAKSSLSVTPSDKESDLCTKSKKKRRSIRKFQRDLDIENRQAVSSEIPTPGIPIVNINFTNDADTDDKSELMSRFCKSFQTAIESAFPYQSYNAAGVTTATATVDKRYKVPNPDSDDYLESLQKRW